MLPQDWPPHPPHFLGAEKASAVWILHNGHQMHSRRCLKPIGEWQDLKDFEQVNIFLLFSTYRDKIET